jgi:hypothetical protein
MSGVIPLFPLYVFMAWIGKILPFDLFLPVTQCKIQHDKNCSRISGLPVFGSLNLFTEDCSVYLMTSGHISRLSCKGQMIESTVLVPQWTNNTNVQSVTVLQKKRIATNYWTHIV